MKINCTGLGKRYNRDWIFRNFNHQFIGGSKYALTGPNGSGKSTLLQIISGALVSSEGELEYTISEKVQEPEKIFNLLSFSAPYLDVIEEMTIAELLRFHQKFKSFLPGIDIKDIVSIMGLQTAVNKQIRYYSSGMKQRVKLAQAVFSNVPVLLLDEPCTNLDAAGYDLYNDLIKKYCMNRLVIVSSNDVNEYHFCDNRLNVMDYK